MLNDLHAIAHAVPHLTTEEMVTIKLGRPQEHAPLAVLAPGNGLGEAFLIWGGTDYIACSSEGGHADFGPTNPTQVGLLAFLVARYRHAAYERVCSGSGLADVYDYVHSLDPAAENPAFAAALFAAKDRAPSSWTLPRATPPTIRWRRRRCASSSMSETRRPAISRSRCWRREASISR